MAHIQQFSLSVAVTFVVGNEDDNLELPHPTTLARGLRRRDSGFQRSGGSDVMPHHGSPLNNESLDLLSYWIFGFAPFPWILHGRGGVGVRKEIKCAKHAGENAR